MSTATQNKGAERRRHAATAVVGGGAVAGGGLLRHEAVERHIKATGENPKVHALAINRRGSLGTKRLWRGGAALGAVGAVPLTIGSYKLARSFREVEKKDSFFREGLKGTGNALIERAENTAQPVPFKARATALGGSAAAAAGGAFATRGLMRGSSGRAKAVVAPVAGVLTGVAATPATSKLVERVSPGYRVTPTGVERKKKAAKRPSSQAAYYDGRHGQASFRAAVVPSDVRKNLLIDALELGALASDRDVRDTVRRLPLKQKVVAGATVGAGVAGSMAWGRHQRKKQTKELNARINRVVEQRIAARQGVAKFDAKQYRAKVTGASMLPIPVVQHVSAARMAANAGSEKNRKANFRTQLAAGQGGEIVGAATGAYTGAALANRFKSVESAATKLNSGVDSAKAKVRENVPGAQQASDFLSSVGEKAKNLKPAGAGDGRVSRMVQAAKKPLTKTPAGKAGAVAGALVGQSLIGGGIQQAAISRNIKRERLSKAVSTGLTPREQQKQARRKRFQAITSVTGGVAGLGGLTLLGAAKAPGVAARLGKTPEQLKQLSTTSTTVGAGIGGLGALNYAGIIRREAKSESKQAKQRLAKSMPDQSSLHVPAGLRRTKTYTASTLRRTPTGKLVRVAAGVR